MSIAALKKVSICGLIAEKQQVLDGLQELGALHLVSLREPLDEPEKQVPERPEHTYKALKFLASCPNKRRQIKQKSNFDIAEMVEQTLLVQQNIRDITDQRDFLLSRIKEVSPWGDFELPEKEDLADYLLWFYIVPVGLLGEIAEQDDQAIEIVYRDNRFAYVVVVAKDEPRVNSMPVRRTNIGTLSLTELKASLEETELELEDCHAERESLTRWIYLITQNLASAEDEVQRIHAEQQTLDTDDVFAIQGWFPEQGIDQLSEFTEQYNLALLIEEPKRGDNPPTLMVNSQQLSAGEGLVKFYQTPSYWDWDPSVPVFMFFSLFFAMILSDAGYAAFFAVLLVTAWNRMGQSSTGRAMRNLLTTLISFSFIWGVMVGSYFGVTPAETSLLGKLKILELNDFDSMMRLSVCIGVLHLSYANAHKAWRLREDDLTWLAPLGWIVIMCGGLLVWFDGSFEQPSDWYLPVGKGLIGLGFIAVFLFSSARKIKKPTDLVMRVLDGLQGVSGITKMFGDVLSYLRLFALGLAGSSLAITFNNLAMQAKEVEGPGLLYCLLILLLGHSLNILLSLMSGVVHGLRLNVIEFFNWGLTDEGHPYNTFSKKEISE
ncbi:MAG: ATPase [Gammaproteobacteria bacterium]|nr:MAG: ATPase [Gammaproteobacteria bacterium]RLA24403.1 MAG: ATPase [Gammaproteobacteria bacterium]